MTATAHAATHARKTLDTGQPSQNNDQIQKVKMSVESSGSNPQPLKNLNLKVGFQRIEMRQPREFRKGAHKQLIFGCPILD
jgi:hypothetical protein